MLVDWGLQAEQLGEPFPLRLRSALHHRPNLVSRAVCARSGSCKRADCKFAVSARHDPKQKALVVKKIYGHDPSDKPETGRYRFSQSAHTAPATTPATWQEAVAQWYDHPADLGGRGILKEGALKVLMQLLYGARFARYDCLYAVCRLALHLNPSPTGASAR